MREPRKRRIREWLSTTSFFYLYRRFSLTWDQILWFSNSSRIYWPSHVLFSSFFSIFFNRRVDFPTLLGPSYFSKRARSCSNTWEYAICLSVRVYMTQHVHIKITRTIKYLCTIGTAGIANNLKLLRWTQNFCNFCKWKWHRFAIMRLVRVNIRYIIAYCIYSRRREI